MNRVKQLFPVLMLVLILKTSLLSAQEPSPGDNGYDPSVHIYTEGLEISASDTNVQIGTLEDLTSHDSSLSPDNAVQPLAVEAGSWFYPKGDKSTDHYPDNIRWNACGGGDDHWSDYYYINENKLLSHDIVVWADNLVNQLQINSHNPPGLDGGYYCVGGLCSLSVCSTGTPLGNPNSVFISHN